MKKVLGAIGTAVVFVAGIVPLTLPAAQASVTGTITIVETGGSSEGSTWSYNSSFRRIEAGSTTSINADVIEAFLGSGDLTIWADEIVISTNLDWTSNRLTFRSEGSIRMPGGLTINSGGGDVLFQADSDDSGFGEIRLGTLATNGGSITTGGGDISLVGGSDPSVGFAKSTSSSETGKPAAGVALYGFDLDAGGGDVTIRGAGSTSVSTRAVMFERGSASYVSSITTSGNGAVSIVGDGSNIQAGSNAWGVTISALDITNGSGAIEIRGTGNPSVSNSRGIVAGTFTVSSNSGDVDLIDYSDSSSANYLGTYLPGVTITTEGDVSFQADEFNGGGNLVIDAASFAMESYSTTSFQAATSLGAIDLTGTPTAQLGHPSNTANLIVSGLTRSDGSVTLNSTGTITQTAELVVPELSFGSTADVTLSDPDNDVDTIAAGATVGDFVFVDKDDLEIGTVGSSTGINSSGSIRIETISGDLTLTQPLSASATSTDSVILAADNDAAAGAAGDGNLVFSGSGAVSIDATSRALLYSGERSASSGLTAAVGGEAQTRNSVGRSTALGTITPAIGSTGSYALYRTNTVSTPDAPTGLTANLGADSQSAELSWQAPASTGGAAITGYKVEMNDGSGWSTAIADTGTVDTFATVDNLPAGASYEFRVSAINSAGTSATSQTSASLEISQAVVDYSGPLVRYVGNRMAGAFQVAPGQSVRVEGERLESVTAIFVDGREGTIISTSDDHFIMIFPSGVSVGKHDLVITSDIGNVTFLDGFIVSTDSSNISDANAVCDGAETSWWTKRISETEVKAYIKCPEVGRKYQILHQTGGSGNYDSVFAKTLADTSDPTQIFNSVGRYIVRTIRLEDVSRIRISVDGSIGWQVRYNRP